jgi:hypothetical protein
MRYPEPVLTAIYEKYAPSISEKKESILFVGPFLDGLSSFLPEMFTIPFPTTNGPEHARRHLKSMLADTMAGDRARNLMTKDLSLIMRRSSWEPDKRSGRAPSVMLNDRLRDAEPGELINSYQFLIVPETGERELVEQIHEGEWKPFVPNIREDKRFGLHYLLVGDEFSMKFTTRKGSHVELEFRLRPPGEGSSLLTPAQQQETVAW